jgi:hypothetical protein
MGKEFPADLESSCVGNALSSKYPRLSLLKKLLIMLGTLLKKLLIMLGIAYAALHCKIIENQYQP